MSQTSKMAVLALCVTVFAAILLFGKREGHQRQSTTPSNPVATNSNGHAGEEPGDVEEAPVSKDAIAKKIPEVDPHRQIEDKIRRALQKRETVNWEDEPLREVILSLAVSAGINVVLDEVALQEEGIASDEPIFAHLKNVRIETVLNRILESQGLTWVIEDDVLKITTRVVAEEKLFTRVYDVHDLLARMNEAKRKIKERTGEDLNSQHSLPSGLQFCQFGGGGFGGNFGVPAGGGNRENVIGQLIEAIMSCTSGHWEEIDGDGGTISEMEEERVLVIRHTQKVHDEIQGLLITLESFAFGTAKQNAIHVRPTYYPREDDEAIRKALKKIISVEIIDTPLQDALVYLEAQTGIPIWLEAHALAEEGIDIYESAPLKVSEISFGSALKLLLDPLGLTYYIEDGLLIVTTEIAAEENIETVVYDVGDFPSAQSGNADSLIGTIMNTTSGPWEETDGGGGTTSFLVPGSLIVSQTPRVHNEIAQLLANMRRTIGVHAKVDQKKTERDLAEFKTEFYPVGDALAEETLEAITTLVAKDTWGDGPKSGSIRKLGGVLVIRQSVRVHNQIRRFLNDYNRARMQLPSGGAAVNQKGTQKTGSGFFSVR